MKIAVPCENEQVVFHLKDARQYKIYDCLDDEILSEEFLALDGDASSITDILTARGVYVLICGLLPISILIKLQNSRIQVLGGAAGYADDRVRDFLSGTLHFDRGGEYASCSGACSLRSGNQGNASDDSENTSGAAEEPECDGNISACGHWCH